MHASKRRIGDIVQWHVVLPTAFRHIVFGFCSVFPEEPIVLGPPFAKSRFTSVRTIGDAIDGVRSRVVSARRVMARVIWRCVCLIEDIS